MTSHYISVASGRTIRVKVRKKISRAYKYRLGLPSGVVLLPDSCDRIEEDNPIEREQNALTIPNHLTPYIHPSSFHGHRPGQLFYIQCTMFGAHKRKTPSILLCPGFYLFMQE